MRFGSVCSGIEAASAAWMPLGWEAAWLSEIEPFPCAVLAHHYPEAPNLGDMTTLPDRIASGEVEAPDVFTGGTPCQAFSVAGKRGSLSDDRGNLSLTFCEIANAIDDVRADAGREPCIVVWENVPGVLSTSDNAFGCFLGALAGSGCELQPAGGRWTNAGVVLGPRRTVAWRVIDAQFFSLAQRRRRVFVVASARKGFDPAQVLFEWDGVRRDSAPRREAGQGAARGAPEGAGSGGSVISMAHGQGDAEIGFNREPTLTCNHEAPIVAHSLRGEGFDASEDGTGRGTPLVPVSVALRGREDGATDELGDDVAFALRASSGGGDKPHVMAPVAIRTAQTGSNGWGINTEGTAYTLDSAQQAVAFDTTQITSAANYSNPKPGDPCHPLAAGAHPPAVAFDWQSGGDARGLDPKDIAQLQRCQVPAALTGMAVRRLTPRECERLQGFPDDFTRIPWRNKPAEDCPDGPRYKALGNSWAVPCAAWIGARFAKVVA